MSNTKKGLLNENTIRRFMKLAEIDELSNGFVDGLVREGKHEPKPDEKEMKEMAHPPKRDDDEEVEEGMGHYRRDDQMEEGAHEPLDTGEEESGVTGPDMDDLDMADVEVGDDASDLTSAVANLMGVISSMTGVEIDVDGGDDEEVDLDVEDEVMEQQKPGDRLGPEAQRASVGKGTPPSGPASGKTGGPAKAGPAKAGAAGAAAGATAGKRMGMKEEVLQYREALKQEVLRRVHGRIQQERYNDAVADELSERILQRIKSNK